MSVCDVSGREMMLDVWEIRILRGIRGRGPGSDSVSSNDQEGRRGIEIKILVKREEGKKNFFTT